MAIRLTFQERQREAARRTALEGQRPSYPFGMEPRQALAQIAAAERQTMADLAYALGRAPDYVARFVRDGVPRALAQDDVQRIADFLGVSRDALGVRDYWL